MSFILTKEGTLISIDFEEQAKTHQFGFEEMKNYGKMGASHLFLDNVFQMFNLESISKKIKTTTIESKYKNERYYLPILFDLRFEKRDTSYWYPKLNDSIIDVKYNSVASDYYEFMPNGKIIFPPQNNSQEFIVNINPDTIYDYWEYRSINNSIVKEIEYKRFLFWKWNIKSEDCQHYNIICKGGEDTTLTKKVSKYISEKGIFRYSEFWSSGFDNIVAVKNRQIIFIDNDIFFTKFLGNIDNLYEASVIFEIQKPNYVVCSGFKLSDFGYEVYCIKNIEACNQDLYLITISKDGKFSEKRIGKYLITRTCAQEYRD